MTDSTEVFTDSDVRHALRDLTEEELKAIAAVFSTQAGWMRSAILRADPTFDFQTMTWTNERQNEAKP